MKMAHVETYKTKGVPPENETYNDLLNICYRKYF